MNRSYYNAINLCEHYIKEVGGHILCYLPLGDDGWIHWESVACISASQIDEVYLVGVSTTEILIECLSGIRYLRW